MRSERGVTLIEMLIALVIFLIVLAGAMSAIGAQSRGFNKGIEEMGILQNLRYGVQQMEMEIRMAGSNTADRQPQLIYAGDNAFAFNADLISNVVGDISAVYIDPDAPAGHVSAMTTAMAGAIPGSSPAFTHPLANFATSPAETIVLWFTANTETTRADDFVLMRRVNDRPAETLVRNILAPAGGLPFFSYRYLSVPGAGNPTLAAVPAGWLPLRHTSALHGTITDVGVAARIDSLRAVEVRYRVTNGSTGTLERIREISTVIPLPNVGMKKVQACGDPPLFGQAVVAVWVDSTATVDVRWNPSVDDLGGEEDLLRYVIWRRPGAGLWGDPVASVASGTPPYLLTDAGVASGTSVQYAVAAQDCTPTLSPQSFSNTVAVP